MQTHIYQSEETSGGRRHLERRLSGQAIRIHTLGRFGIQIDGKPLSARELRQQKPIELLQCLIALGGRGVSKDYLAAALWPEAEGDAGVNSYDVTLHRLRKLLRHEQALIASDSRLTINNVAVWVDVWTFEKLLNDIGSTIQVSGSSDIAVDVGRLLTLATTLYQGGFLAREVHKPWGLSLRERLRSKFMRCVVQLGQRAEDAGRWDIAVNCYQAGIEVDPLYELFYQRLMICYRETKRKSEGLSVYIRCRANLFSGLCVAPSSETEKIRSSL